MALLVAGDFSGFSATYAVPADYTGLIYNGSVDLILSTNITQSVFDSLSTAVKCIHYMDANDLYSLSPNEDITILNLRSKMLILENTYINQKMMNTYVFTYHGASVKAIHRSTSTMVSLEEALTAMGFRCVGTPWETGDINAKLELNRADKERPRIAVVDYLYRNPSTPTSLTDASPIIISGV